jgi:hypothetical protein
MKIFGKTLVPLLLAAGELDSCNGSLAAPTLSQANKMETAIATASTALAETHTPSPSPSRAPSKSGGFWQFSI